MRRLTLWLPLLLTVCWLPALARARHAPLRETWDYVAPMKKVASRQQGREGVVLHVGDSITYANPYGQWARAGRGKTGGRTKRDRSNY